MKKLCDVWAKNVINGTFKGTASAFAFQAFQNSRKLVYLGKPVKSMLELMAIQEDQLFLADEEIVESESSIKNVLKQFEGKEIETQVLLDRLKPFIKPGEDILADLYNKGMLEYRMDKTYVKSEDTTSPEMMSPIKLGFTKAAKVLPAKKADVLFLQNVLNCPNCGMHMKSVKLAGGVGSWFCPNCRHTDFDEKAKSTLNANIQTVDKILQFKQIDNGNCEIVN